jgi:hypothetical protein
MLTPQIQRIKWQFIPETVTAKEVFPKIIF